MTEIEKLKLKVSELTKLNTELTNDVEYYRLKMNKAWIDNVNIRNSKNEELDQQKQMYLEIIKLLGSKQYVYK